jgi:conflict system STAND superfamily ATPase
MAFEEKLQSYQDHLSEQRSKAHYRHINPFRGLEFFDSEHAAFFYGRTKTVQEMLDVLQQQAAAQKPFLLLLVQ